MSRSERWNTPKEIKDYLEDAAGQGAGPILYAEGGRKYCDTSEAHIGVIGRTGKGKSQCVSLPFMREILMKGESLIMLDPKGEGYQKNACRIPENYQVAQVYRGVKGSNTKLDESDMGRKFNISFKLYDETSRRVMYQLSPWSSANYDNIDWDANMYYKQSTPGQWDTYSFDYRIDDDRDIRIDKNTINK